MSTPDPVEKKQLNHTVFLGGRGGRVSSNTPYSNYWMLHFKIGARWEDVSRNGEDGTSKQYTGLSENTTVQMVQWLCKVMPRCPILKMRSRFTLLQSNMAMEKTPFIDVIDMYHVRDSFIADFLLPIVDFPGG